MPKPSKQPTQRSFGSQKKPAKGRPQKGYVYKTPPADYGVHASNEDYLILTGGLPRPGRRY